MLEIKVFNKLWNEYIKRNKQWFKHYETAWKKGVNNQNQIIHIWTNLETEPTTGNKNLLCPLKYHIIFKPLWCFGEIERYVDKEFAWFSNLTKSSAVKIWSGEGGKDQVGDMLCNLNRDLRRREHWRIVVSILYQDEKRLGDVSSFSEMSICQGENNFMISFLLMIQFSVIRRKSCKTKKMYFLTFYENN